MLEELRQEVWYCNLQLPKNGLVKMTSGNVSGRDPKTNLVVIKPSGYPYEELTSEKMVVVNIDGGVVEGDLLPSVDTATHLHIYRHRTDVNGITHTHSPYATSFAVLGQPIPACVTTSALVGGEVPVGGYRPPTGGEGIGKEMLRVIGDAMAVIMQNHGVFTIGSSATEATKVAVELEAIAQIAHLAMLRGTPICLTKEQLDEMAWHYDRTYGQSRKGH